MRNPSKFYLEAGVRLGRAESFPKKKEKEKKKKHLKKKIIVKIKALGLKSCPREARYLLIACENCHQTNPEDP